MANENVLVGFDASDDAGIYRLNSECALVQTVDFFTPIVDDPYTYGAIAAANALSDVFAMGGRPLTALSIVAYPGQGDLEALEQILLGGASKMQEAGCVVIGGHSVNDEEVKFGYAVTGLVHPERFWTNAGAKPGDVLLLTKAIGTGVIATALKRGIARQEHVAAAVGSMLTLNQQAAQALDGLRVHACTDVTGFGLLGHGREVALASNATLQIDAGSVPQLAGALEYARQGAVPGGLKNNREFASCAVEIAGDLDPALELLLYDPQTSGGLLVSIDPQDADAFQRRFPAAVRIGQVIERASKWIQVI